MRKLKAGATSQSIYLAILDSASTTGGRKTGIAYNTASLVAYYTRNQGSATAITLATLAAANSAYSSGGFKEVDATNAPGLYRLDLPDAAIAAGVPSVVIVIKGASGMVQVEIEVQLEVVDAQDGVRYGITALPNAAAEAAGGLFTRGTGAGQINQPGNGLIDVSLKAILNTALTETSGQIAAAFKQFFDIASPTGTMKAITNVVTATNLTTNNDKTGYGLSAAAVQAIWDAAVANLTTAASIGKRIVDYLTGDSYARLGAPAGASHAADVAAVQADTDDIQTRIPVALTAGGRIKASVEAWKDSVPSSLIAGRVDANAQVIGLDALDATAVKTDGAAEIAAAVRDVSNASPAAGSLGLDAKNAAAGSDPAAIADELWREPIADHSGVAGSMAEKLNAAGNAGDPWSTALPSTYVDGTAGKRLGKLPSGSKQGQHPDGTGT